MRVLLLGVIATVFWACGPPPPSETRSEKLAKALCGCTTKLLQLNQQAQTTQDSTAFRNIATEYEKTRECVRNLGIKPEDRAALMSALPVLCPALDAQKDFLPELLAQ